MDGTEQQQQQKKKMSYSQAAQQQEEPKIVVKEVNEETGETSVIIEEALAAFIGRKVEGDQDVPSSDGGDEGQDGNDDIQINFEDLWVSFDDQNLAKFALANSVSPIYLVTLTKTGCGINISTNDLKFDDGKTQKPRWQRLAPTFARNLVSFINSSDLVTIKNEISPATPLSLSREVITALIGDKSIAAKLLTSEQDVIESWIQSQNKRDNATKKVAVPKIVFDYFVETGELPKLIGLDADMRPCVIPNNEASAMMSEPRDSHSVEPQRTYIGGGAGAGATAQNGVMSQLNSEYWDVQHKILSAMEPQQDQTAPPAATTTSSASSRRRRRRKKTAEGEDGE